MFLKSSKFNRQMTKSTILGHIIRQSFMNKIVSSWLKNIQSFLLNFIVTYALLKSIWNKYQCFQK